MTKNLVKIANPLGQSSVPDHGTTSEYGLESLSNAWVRVKDMDHKVTASRVAQEAANKRII